MTNPNTARAEQPASDLRRRAACARDAAGRFIKRHAAAETSAAADRAKPDPALAAATVFRASWNALGEVLNAEAPDDMTAELSDAQAAAYDRLRVVRPTTPAGFRALAECWSIMLKGERGDEEGITLADDAADSLIAGAGACVPCTPPVDAKDPVLALIEEHRTAFAEWDRLSAVWSEMLLTDSGYAEAMAATNEPGRREVSAYNALFEARPASLAGAAAWAAYLDQATSRTRIDVEPSDGERALGAVAAALQRFAVPHGGVGLPSFGDTHFSPHPDAALFALGNQFMSAWVAEEADGDEPEYRICTRIAQQIIRTPAVTVAGYGIKALLLARLDSDDTGPHKPIEASGPPDSWWNALRQVQQGAALLAAAPDMGIPMSATPDPVTGIPVSAGLIEERLPALGHDLSRLSIVELARLYPVVVRVEEVMGSAENAPCFWEAPNTYRTPAGKIINREADRLGQFTSAIAEEMKRRRPADDDEAEERANTLLWHTVVTGGVAEHPELIAEINATWGA